MSQARVLPKIARNSQKEPRFSRSRTVGRELSQPNASLQRWQPDVLVHVSGERRATGDVPVFAVLDQADGAKNYGQGDGGAGLALSLAALCALQVNVVAADHQILQLHAQLTPLTHHPRFCTRED